MTKYFKHKGKGRFLIDWANDGAEEFYAIERVLAYAMEELSTGDLAFLLTHPSQAVRNLVAEFSFASELSSRVDEPSDDVIEKHINEYKKKVGM